jgi:hypothetical protein
MARDQENAKRLRKEWYERNKELTKQRAREWAAANPEKRHAIHRKNREKDRENHNARNREWWSRNKPKRASYQSKRRAALLQRTPKWLTEDDFWMIEEAYKLAALRTKMFGFPWHVDHVIPLQGCNVSGLHTPTNLQVISGAENVRKHNSWGVKSPVCA